MARDGATRLRDHVRSAPASSWAALAGAALAVALTARSALSSADAGPVVGGLLVFVTPYLVAALALHGRSVGSKGLGVGVAAVTTWLTSFGVTEFIASVQHATPLRPMALTFFVLTIVGVAVVGFGLRDLARAAHAAGYWARTPLAARLAFLGVAYWALTFVADTYLSGNPPLARMLMAPALVIAHLAAAPMLRAPVPGARLIGVLLAAGAGLATAAYWVTYARYLTLTGGPAAIPYLSYWTALPWPVLLSLSLSLDAAIVAIAARRQLMWAARKSRTVWR